MTISRLIYVAANGIISFFFIAELFYCTHTHTHTVSSLFIHLSMDIYVSSKVLAIENSAVMNIGMHGSLQITVFS